MGAEANRDVKPGVLLVDDVEANLVALRGLLGHMDCELVSASSGNEALKQLLKRSFAVILLDVQMPEMDGYEVARYARANPATQDVPIIFLTATHQTEDNLLRGYGSGAVDYLFKPISPVILRSKVRVFLDLFTQRRRLEHANVELRRMTDEASSARAHAERSSHFKSRFVANMSHELRTPLNSIIGFSELLGENLEGQHKEFAGYIVESGHHLLTLINDILDLSTIEAGRINLRGEWVALDALIGTVAETIHPLAKKRGIKLRFDVQPGLPEIFVDPTRFKQVLYNLLSNGIKFTAPGGSVRLGTRLTADRVSIDVEDTGIGISAANLPRLFQEFERIEPESDGAGSKAEGTGLGLALSKRLIELHGGRITVESHAGKGSTFTVEVALQPAASGVAPPAPAPAGVVDNHDR
jgi:signal transduction histidine kinase